MASLKEEAKAPSSSTVKKEKAQAGFARALNKLKKGLQAELKFICQNSELDVCENNTYKFQRKPGSDDEINLDPYRNVLTYENR